MAAKYTLKVLADFAAAHSLRDYPGDCRRLHGHNWKVEVEVESNRLNELGMVVDFKAIKQATRAVVDELDHRYLNEIPPFDELNPTAENIAAFIHRGVTQAIAGPAVRVSAVTLWETERACVRYTEEG